MTDPYAALEAANIGLANVLSYRTYSGSRAPGKVEWDSAQRALDLVRAALDARQAPVAWQYKGEPWFDGAKWHDVFSVTNDSRLAHFKDKSPTPLYTAPLTR
ncbi:MAG TPA: hypothetical protein PKA88_30665 [Polyangiaceae bacterium]|nr:hypothetical protein [Polyangiaceae bacterium]